MRDQVQEKKSEFTRDSSALSQGMIQAGRFLTKIMKKMHPAKIE